MYFWDIESLKEDIRRGEFADKELIPYILMSVALYAMGIEFAGYFPYEDSGIWIYLLSILNILIPVGGTLYVYKKMVDRKEVILLPSTLQSGLLLVSDSYFIWWE